MHHIQVTFHQTISSHLQLEFLFQGHQRLLPSSTRKEIEDLFLLGSLAVPVEVPVEVLVEVHWQFLWRFPLESTSSSVCPFWHFRDISTVFGAITLKLRSALLRTLSSTPSKFRARTLRGCGDLRISRKPSLSWTFVPCWLDCNTTNKRESLFTGCRGGKVVLRSCDKRGSP